jgi:squalene cyclase
MADAVETAIEVLKSAGWQHVETDGAAALWAPEPEPAPEVWGFTVQVEGRDEADCTRALLRRLVDRAADRDRFTVIVSGVTIWPVPE